MEFTCPGQRRERSNSARRGPSIKPKPFSQLFSPRAEHQLYANFYWAAVPQRAASTLARSQKPEIAPPADVFSLLEDGAQTVLFE